MPLWCDNLFLKPQNKARLCDTQNLPSLAHTHTRTQPCGPLSFSLISELTCRSGWIWLWWLLTGSRNYLPSSSTSSSLLTLSSPFFSLASLRSAQPYVFYQEVSALITKAASYSFISSSALGGRQTTSSLLLELPEGSYSAPPSHNPACSFIPTTA